MFATVFGWLQLSSNSVLLVHGCFFLNFQEQRQAYLRHSQLEIFLFASRSLTEDSYAY